MYVDIFSRERGRGCEEVHGYDGKNHINGKKAKTKSENE